MTRPNAEPEVSASEVGHVSFELDPEGLEALVTHGAELIVRAAEATIERHGQNCTSKHPQAVEADNRISVSSQKAALVAGALDRVLPRDEVTSWFDEMAVRAVLQAGGPETEVGQMVQRLNISPVKFS